MRTIDKILTKGYNQYGAFTGRSNVPATGGWMRKYPYQKIYDCAVPMDESGAYDKGGAYWGNGPQLRVSYTKDLSYVNFYRVGSQW